MFTKMTIFQDSRFTCFLWSNEREVIQSFKKLFQYMTKKRSREVLQLMRRISSGFFFKVDLEHCTNAVSTCQKENMDVRTLSLFV